eukprot:TRINITY_DN745_c0_g2_i4.p1 TRINITY_DN745_c0_g2~~TRINITY_DN745_c0_g2_i4.p1  ORF type:complete len:1210 (+),score=339.19 TRINITY_DN745_c0_g2_i4:57-3686(+)
MTDPPAGRRASRASVVFVDEADLGAGLDLSRKDSESQADVHPADGPTGFTQKNGGACSRFLSIGGVVGMMSMFSIALSVVVSAVMLGVSCTDAVGATKGYGDRATLSCYATANVMVQNTMSQMMRPSAVATVGEIQMFLDGPVQLIDRMGVQYYALKDAPKGEPDFHTPLAAHVWGEIEAIKQFKTHQLQPVATRGAGIYHGDHGLSNFLIAFTETYSVVWSFRTVNDSSTSAPALSYSGLPDEGSEFASPAQFRPGAITMVNVTRAHPERFQDWENRYGPLESISGFLGYVLFARLPDPTMALPGVEAVVYIDIWGIEELFTKLVEKSCRQFALQGGRCPPMRLFSMVRSSWLAGFKRSVNASDWAAYEQDGLLTGASHGGAARRYWGFDAFEGRLARLQAPVNATRARDPVIRKLTQRVQAAYGGFEAVLTGDSQGFKVTDLSVDMVAASLYYDGLRSHNDSVPFDQDPGGDYDVWWNSTNGGEDEVIGDPAATTEYVMVVENVTDPRGLDWHLVFASPTQPLLEEVARIQAAEEARTEADKERVEETVRRDKLHAYIGVAVIGAVCAVVATLVTQRMCVRPIQKIQAAMQDVAGMDLDAADMAVSQASFMSDIRQMQHDFTVMIINLREYRAYVPAALLQANGRTKKVRDPPEGDVAILFSDIKGSTALWKECAVGMNTALETHNEVIRSFYDKYAAYEVKTIGDAFMVAYPAPDAAVGFGLCVQGDLFAAEWPAAIQQHEYASRSACGSWNGIRVRVGINFGLAEVVEERGRIDYFGPVVNVAARVEGQCVPGAVCVTDAVLAAMSLEDVGDPVAIDMGERELKGVKDAMRLRLLVPAEMTARLRAVNALLSASGSAEEERDLGDVVSCHSLSEWSSGPPSLGGFENASDGSSHSYLSRSGNSATSWMTRDRLESKRCTVARTHFQYPGTMMTGASDPVRLVQGTLDAVLSAAKATQGTLHFLYGATALLSWQQVRGAEHVRNAFAYTGHLADALTKPEATCKTMTGVASGRLLAGNVGSVAHGQRFTTVLGPPLTLAGLLCEGCTALPAGALYANLGDNGPLRWVKKHLRPVDTWEAEEGMPGAVVLKEVTVYQIRAQAPRPVAVNPLEAVAVPALGVDGDDAAWGAAYWQAYETRSVGRLGLQDPVAAAVQALQERGASLRAHPVPLDLLGLYRELSASCPGGRAVKILPVAGTEAVAKCDNF